MQVSIPSNQMQVPTKQSSQRYSFAADNSEDMDIDPFVVVEPMRPEQMHVRQFRRHEDTSVTPTIQSASFPTGVTTPGPTPSCTPVEHEVSFLTQHQQQQQQAQAQLQVQQKYQQSGFDIGFGSSEISLADTLTFGTGALGLTSPLTRKTAKDQEIRIDPHSMNNLTPGSPKKPPNSHRNSFGRAAHLPFLNLSAVKHYTGWPGSPIKPPTPLAQPPTPLTHPTGAIYVHDGHHHQQQSPHHRQHQYQHQAHDTPTHPSVGTFLPLTGAMIGISGGESSGSGSHVDLHKGKQISAVKMVRTDANTMRPLSPVDGKGARPLSRVFEQQQQPALHHPQPPRPQSRRLQQQPQHQLQQNQQQAVGTLRPFALPPNQAQQYMSFNLDESSPSPSPTLGETPISPPLTPGVPEGQQTVQAHAGSPLQCLPQVQRVVPQAVSKLAPPSLKVCTPPTKIVSTPSGLVANGTEVATAGNSPSPSPVSTENIIPPGLQAKAAPKSNSIPTVAEFLAGGTVSTILEQQYQLLDELGAGGFGFVLRAKRKVDGLIVAIKFIFRERIPSHGWVRTRSWTKTADGQPGPEKLVPLEAYVLRMIRHPGVVAFLDLIEDDKVMYLVMEHHGTPWTSASSPVNKKSPKSLAADQGPFVSSDVANNGSNGSNNSSREASPDAAAPCSDDIPDISFSSNLSSSPSSSMGPPTPNHTVLPLTLAAPPAMMRRSSCDLFECIEQHSRLPEHQARLVFGQIAEVVYYLSCMGICHRDIKDENIVVDQNFRVKLIDFGSAVLYDARKAPPYHNRFLGTVNFAASEILQGKPYRAPHAEVWSLGVLLSILLTGETPFSSPDNAIEGRISKPKCPVPPMAFDLMCGCLETDPDARFTIQQVRNHPWLYLPRQNSTI